MDIQFILFIIFVICIGLFLYVKRKKVDLQKMLFPVFYVIMYRTKLGLKAMDNWSKRFRRIIIWLGYAGVFVGFIGMAFISYSLIENLVKIFTQPAAVPGVGLVLPFKAKGVFYVPFFYWIVSIFIVAVVHEFSHGIVARSHGMKVKSSGFAFMSVLVPIIPAAFVEPDEDEIKKRPLKEQLSVFAAGPFSNVILGALVLALLVFAVNPLVGKITEFKGVEVTGWIESKEPLPAQKANISSGEIVKSIDGKNVESIANFTNYLLEHKPGDQVNIMTDKKEYSVTLVPHPENATSPYLGVYVKESSGIKESFISRYGKFTGDAIVWSVGLLFWLFVLNIGIGLFNLVPLGPIDGGRMLDATLKKYLPEKKALRIWSIVAFLFLALILINILFAFFK